MFKKLFSPLVDGISAALAMSGLFGLLHMCGLLDDRVSAAWATGSLGASMVLFISCPESKLTTPRLLPRALASTQLIEAFTGRKVEIDGKPNGPATITIGSSSEQ